MPVTTCLYVISTGKSGKQLLSNRNEGKNQEVIQIAGVINRRV